MIKMACLSQRIPPHFRSCSLFGISTDQFWKYFNQKGSRGHKARGQGQGHKKKTRGQGQPFRGQTLSRSRTGKLEAKAKDQGHKRKCSEKKRSSKFFFRRSPVKNVFQNFFSGDLQNFNNSKKKAVLEPRTGQFLRPWGLEAKAKDFKMCPRELHLWH